MTNASATLSFMTWNVAMLERSAEASQFWLPDHSEATIRERVLAIGPDLVAFQELPGMVPFVETHDMVRANPLSHQGNLATLVRNEVMAAEGETGPTVTVVDGCALLATFSGTGLRADGLTVANVHLVPGPGAGDLRRDQLAAIVEASPTEDLLVIGDTNTRLDEVEAIEALGLSGDKPPIPTWNSKRNRFHQAIPEFTAYFTRWFATERVQVTDAKVWTDRVEFSGQKFHISDHYALSGSVSVS